MSDAEKEIWRAAYAAAFVAEVGAVAQFLKTTKAAALARPGARYMFAEVARSVADEAVLGLRETDGPNGTRLSAVAT